MATDPSHGLEHQYGKIPPLGCEIVMPFYRTGGGTKGNVEAGKLSVLKSAIPYVKSVINYSAAKDGNDAESLEQAILRVPSLLRTREAAVIPEDFERVAKQASRAIARAHCLRGQDTPGLVRLLIVPRADTLALETRGINPDTSLVLQPSLETTIQDYLQNRKPLGVQVKLR
jgi:predicted phage baseplate assembly protein